MAVDPHPSEGSLKIMCMYFILSGPRTSLQILDHIHLKNLQHNCPVMKVGGEGRLEFFQEFIGFDSAISP